MATSDKVIVVAIDFGTTYSGWAFSSKHDFDTDPTKISAKTKTGGQLLSLKEPTCALIGPDGDTIDSFGFEAEDKYELTEEGKHTQWYFFKRFRSVFDQIKSDDLSEERNSERTHWSFLKWLKKKSERPKTVQDITIEDENGRTLPAKKILSLCIGYLKNDSIKSFNRQTRDDLTNYDMNWVLTVPAIWNDVAKQFMREAAEEADIPIDKLTIGLEPEVALLYCRHLPLNKFVGQDSLQLGNYKPGTKHLVLDAGGGTVDITILEVEENDTVKELHKASGGAWGGTKVNEAFREFLVKIFGVSVIKRFEDERKDDFLDLFRDFEVKKRKILKSTFEKITVRMPPALKELVFEHSNKSIAAAVRNSAYAHGVMVLSDKMRINADVFITLFDGPIKNIVDHVRRILLEPDARGCEAIIMVGGFSESSILQEKIRMSFPRLKIIIPQEAGLAVMAGAVIYGHSSSTSTTVKVCYK